LHDTFCGEDCSLRLYGGLKLDLAKLGCFDGLIAAQAVVGGVVQINEFKIRQVRNFLGPGNGGAG